MGKSQGRVSSKNKGEPADKDKERTSHTKKASSLAPPLIRDREDKLNLQTLLLGHIWVIPHFFTDSECDAWIGFAEASQLEHLAQRGTRLMAARQCYRMQVIDNVTAQKLMDRLQRCCSAALQLLDDPCRKFCNPNLRLYKYSKGMSFGKHIDESNVLPGLGVTRMTILVYLSSCQGGATRFDKPDGSGEVAFNPTVGSMLIHLHGDDCLLHQADPVIAGTKYVLRTDLVYGMRGARLI
jgi:2OG-Fe(II) oxygenase superfamily